MIILQLIALFVVSWFAASVSDDGRWPQFRGPQSVGVVEDPQLPDKWSATENVAWKSDIPGLGWSSHRLGRQDLRHLSHQLRPDRTAEEGSLFGR